MLKSSYIAHNPVILWPETLQYLFWESLEISNTTEIEVTCIRYRYSTFPLRCLRRNRSLQSCRTFFSTLCQVHRMDLQNTGCSSMLTNCGLGKWQLARETKPHKTASKFTANVSFKISQTWESTGDTDAYWSYWNRIRFFCRMTQKDWSHVMKNRGDVFWHYFPTDWVATDCYHP